MGGAAAAAVGSAAGAAASVAGSASRFALGSSVVVVGLKAKPQLNGQAASVLGWDETKGRYNVSLSSGGVLALKPDNLSANLMPAGGGGGGASGGGGDVGGFGDFGDFGSAAAPLPAAAAAAPDIEFGGFCGSGGSGGSTPVASAPVDALTAAPMPQSMPQPGFGVESPSGLSEAGASPSSPAALLKPHLLQLRECYSEGLITLEEFEREKALLLRTMRPTSTAEGSSGGLA